MTTPLLSDEVKASEAEDGPVEAVLSNIDGIVMYCELEYMLQLKKK